jgi:hypothetical protein
VRNIVRAYEILAVQFEPYHIEEHRLIEASSLGEALLVAERQDAGRATYVYGICPEDFDQARDEGIEFNEADGLLV